MKLQSVLVVELNHRARSDDSPPPESGQVESSGPGVRDQAPPPLWSVAKSPAYRPPIGPEPRAEPARSAISHLPWRWPRELRASCPPAARRNPAGQKPPSSSRQSPSRPEYRAPFRAREL